MLTIEFDKPITHEVIKHLAEQMGMPIMMYGDKITFMTDYTDIQSFGYGLTRCIKPFDFKVLTINNIKYEDDSEQSNQANNTHQPVSHEHDQRVDTKDSGTGVVELPQSKKARRVRKSEK